MPWESWAKIAPRNLARYVVGPTSLALAGEIPDVNINDVRATDPTRLVAAVYDQLVGKMIDYDLELLDFNVNVQRIRTPFDLMPNSAWGRGTCLDLSLLFAAICVEYRLLPLIVLMDDPGHALVVVNLVTQAEDWDSFGRPEGALDGGVLAGETVATDLGGLVDSQSHIAVECTGFAWSDTATDGRSAKTMTFDEATTAGRARLGTGGLIAALDVATLRARGLDAYLFPTDPLGLSAMDATTDVRRLIERIGDLEAKLGTNPDPDAMRELTQALDEVFKTWRVVDDAVTRFLAGALSTETLTGDPIFLLELRDGRLRVDIADGRGHCHRIAELYNSRIREWFSATLNDAELEEMDMIFGRLSEADLDAFYRMEELGDLLAAEADAVVTIMDDTDLSEGERRLQVRARVRAAADQLRPVRDSMRASMEQMTELKFDILAAV